MEAHQVDCGRLTYYLVWKENSLKEASLRLLENWLSRNG
jgi:LysR family glycine cleavage system transcriptional activator